MMRKVRAVKEGGTVAFVLYDAGAIWGGEAHGSVRAQVSRMMGDRGDRYDVALEQYENHGNWVPYVIVGELGREHPTTCYVCHHGVTLEKARLILGFFAYLADEKRGLDRHTHDEGDGGAKP